MKKLLITSLLASSFAATSFADVSFQDASGMKVNLGGSFDFQGAYIKDNAPKAEKKTSANHKNSAINSSASVFINPEMVTENDLKYGAKLALATTNRNSRGHASYLYVDSNAGKFELGSNKSAAAQMKITGFSACCGAAGDWDVYARFPEEGPFITSFAGYADTSMRNSHIVEYPRKVTYYTPKFNGFQLGVSYIPDTSNIGGKKHSEDEVHLSNKGIKNGQKSRIDLKNTWTYGVSYDNQLNEDLAFKASVVGEYGKSVYKKVDDVKNETDGSKYKAMTSADKNDKLKKLKTVTVGSQVNYKDFTIAASYGNYFKSLTSVNKDGNNRRQNLYSVGAGYTYDKASASLNYFHSNNKQNKLNAYTLSVDYKLAPGLLPYAEFTCYKGKGSKYKDGTPATTEAFKRKGKILMLGTKLKF